METWVVDVNVWRVACVGLVGLALRYRRNTRDGVFVYIIIPPPMLGFTWEWETSWWEYEDVL